MLKNNHLEVEDLLFYGKKGGSRWAHFTAFFPTHVHDVGSILVMSTLGKRSPLHLKAVHEEQVMSASRKKENGNCTKSETGQVFLALHPQLEEPYQQLFSRPQ